VVFAAEAARRVGHCARRSCSCARRKVCWLGLLCCRGVVVAVQGRVKEVERVVRVGCGFDVDRV
jgi:hypothetical protein